MPLRYYANKTHLINGPLQVRSAATVRKATMNAMESDGCPNPGVQYQSTMLLLQNAGSRRSKAIAIAKNRQVVDDHTDQTCSSMERMYDLATWRMFTRITEHRRRFPIRLCSEEAPVTGRYMFNASTTSDEFHDTNTEQRQESNDPDEYFLEGEIFEMEIWYHFYATPHYAHTTGSLPFDTAPSATFAQAAATAPTSYLSKHRTKWAIQHTT